MRGCLNNNNQNNNNTIAAKEVEISHISKKDVNNPYILPNQPLNRPKSYNKNNTVNNSNHINNNKDKINGSQETYSALTQFPDQVYAATNSTLVSDDQYSALTSNDQYSAIKKNDQYSALTLKEQHSTPAHCENEYFVLEKSSNNNDQVESVEKKNEAMYSSLELFNEQPYN